MTDLDQIMSAEFWGDPGCMVMGEWKGELPDLSETEGCVLFQTSGSSGEPKWIVLSKRALHLSARTVNQWLGVNSDSIWGLALPLRHVGGFGVAARARAAQCRIEEFGGKWNSTAFYEWLGEKEITHLSLVPTQLHDLVSAGLRAPASLRAVVVGGGRLDENTGQSARDLGWPVLASYGMTEACSQVATQRLVLLHLPFADAPLEILPGWETAVSEEGVLRLRGDSLFSGTVVEENGAWKYLPRESEWFQTKDRAELAHGTLSLLGRVDSLVKILGELVDIEAVERSFLKASAGKIPAGKIAIVPLPDARREHVLIAVFEKGVEGAEVLFAAFQEKAPGLDRCERMITLNEFPRSGLGKLMRGELADFVATGIFPMRKT